MVMRNKMAQALSSAIYDLGNRDESISHHWPYIVIVWCNFLRNQLNSNQRQSHDKLAYKRWNISNLTTFPWYSIVARPMSLDRALGMKVYNIWGEHWSSLESNKLSYETKATQIYNKQRNYVKSICILKYRRFYQDVWTMHGVRKYVDVTITEHNFSTLKHIRLRRGQLVSAFMGCWLNFSSSRTFSLCRELCN